MKKTRSRPKYKHKRSQGGFSLIETLVTMTMFFFILYGVYAMIAHYGDVTRTEHSRIRMQQESRYLMASFTGEIKEAGAVLTLADTPSFLKEKPYFNGIFPLNQTTFPDGIIIATGDPEATTRLAQPFNGGASVMTVKNAEVPGYDPGLPLYQNNVLPWLKGDKGIVIGKDGYLVFSVESVSTTVGEQTPDFITVRNTAVYYSGLLDTSGHPSGTVRYTDSAPVPGNAVTYPKGAPVVRLTNFSIFLFNEVITPGKDRNTRQLIRVTDTNGVSDVLAVKASKDISIVSENIWDMQISYIAFEKDAFKTADRNTAPDPNHHYFAGGMTSSDLVNLLDDIRTKKLKQLDMTIVSITEELPGKGQKIKEERKIPAIGDQSAYYLPAGKFSYRLMTVSLDPRNYNIIL
jgi:type II secretory pathway pseudopilin PulG